MENDRRSNPQSARFEPLERVLAERGRDLGLGRTRVAATRSGIVIGFPKDPMVHVSWWLLLALGLVAVLRLPRRG